MPLPSRLLPLLFAAFAYIASGCGGSAGARAGDGAPRILVTIKPLHALVASVMGDVSSPVLLLQGVESPHDYALSPSSAAKLRDAEIVFWVGPSLEVFLERPMRSLAANARSVAFARSPSVDTLGSGREGDRGAEIDPHIWLNPENARAVIRIAAQVLGEEDPGNAEIYSRNAARSLARVNELVAYIEEELADVRALPYMTFHDAYRYFETRYGLKSAGSVTLSPDRKPGAKRLIALREKLINEDIRCLFREPQFEPTYISTIVAGTGTRVAVLDPVGANIDPGPDAYDTLMRALVDSFVDCLSAPRAP